MQIIRLISAQECQAIASNGSRSCDDLTSFVTHSSSLTVRPIERRFLEAPFRGTFSRNLFEELSPKPERLLWNTWNHGDGITAME